MKEMALNQFLNSKNFLELIRIGRQILIAGQSVSADGSDLVRDGAPLRNADSIKALILKRAGIDVTAPKPSIYILDESHNLLKALQDEKSTYLKHDLEDASLIADLGFFEVEDRLKIVSLNLSVVAPLTIVKANNRNQYMTSENLGIHRIELKAALNGSASDNPEDLELWKKRKDLLEITQVVDGKLFKGNIHGYLNFQFPECPPLNLMEIQRMENSFLDLP